MKILFPKQSVFEIMQAGPFFATMLVAEGGIQVIVFHLVFLAMLLNGVVDIRGGRNV